MDLTHLDTGIKDALAGRHEPEAFHLLARVYWAGLVSLLAIVTIASIAYGAWEFMRPLEAANESEVTVGAQNSILNRAELPKVLDGFDARAARFEELRRSPETVRDPS